MTSPLTTKLLAFADLSISDRSALDEISENARFFRAGGSEQMDHEARAARYEKCFRREEEAAARASSSASAACHAALADLYRREAAKVRSIRTTLRLAFDD